MKNLPSWQKGYQIPDWNKQFKIPDWNKKFQGFHGMGQGNFGKYAKMFSGMWRPSNGR